MKTIREIMKEHAIEMYVDIMLSRDEDATFEKYFNIIEKYNFNENEIDEIETLAWNEILKENKRRIEKRER